MTCRFEYLNKSYRQQQRAPYAVLHKSHSFNIGGIFHYWRSVWELFSTCLLPSDKHIPFHLTAFHLTRNRQRCQTLRWLLNQSENTKCIYNLRLRAPFNSTNQTDRRTLSEKRTPKKIAAISRGENIKAAQKMMSTNRVRNSVYIRLAKCADTFFLLHPNRYRKHTQQRTHDDFALTADNPVFLLVHFQPIYPLAVARIFQEQTDHTYCQSVLFSRYFFARSEQQKTRDNY